MNDDTTAPTPDPMEWADIPMAISKTDISMTAVEASDDSGVVEYQFICTTGGPSCISSGWQTDMTYVATGLQADTDYSYQVKARDSLGNETSVSVTYTATTFINIAPQSMEDHVIVTENTETIIDVLANDTEPEEEVLQIYSTSVPVHGDVVIIGNTLMYTPDNDYIGADSFEYTITDNMGGFSTSTVTLDVIESNTQPGVIFDDDFESGSLSPWEQLLSGSIELFNDPTDGIVLRKVDQNDPNGGWAPLNVVLDEFELVLYTRKVNNAGGNVIRYSLTDSNGDGYGIKLSYPQGRLGIEKRTNWRGSSVSGFTYLPENMTLNQWYTLRLTRQGNTLNASVYLGQVDPAQATSIAEINSSDSTYTDFSQINIQGGHEFDTDNVLILSETAQTPLNITTNRIKKMGSGLSMIHENIVG